MANEVIGYRIELRIFVDEQTIGPESIVEMSRELSSKIMDIGHANGWLPFVTSSISRIVIVKGSGVA